MSTDQPSGSAAPAPRQPVNGRIVATGVIIGTVLIGLATYYLVPIWVISHLQARPKELQVFLDRLEPALLAYAADHEGQFPPPVSMLDRRTYNKNLVRSRAYRVYALPLEYLTTPVAYASVKGLGDPYASPDQFAPTAYATATFEGQRVAVLTSPGPNLRYDLMAVEVRDVTGMEELLALLARTQYDPTNGTRSGGDMHRLVVFPLQGNP